MMTWPTQSMPQPMSPQRILSHVDGHSFSLDAFDFETPIDASRYFICPTLTPLFYTSVYQTLSEIDCLRYNQLTAMCFGEMIGFFEGAFVSALHTLAGSGDLDEAMAACVAHFIDEEAKHQEMWRRLNRLSEPQWYAAGDRQIVRIPWLAEAALGWFTRRPLQFPVVVWIMLTLEEHSMEISRRCNRMPADAIEPRYRAIYRAHMEEEVRHIHTDWNLLTQLLDRLTSRQRARTAWLFQRATAAFLLKPKRAAVHVINQMIRERPAMRPLRRRMIRELHGLTHHADYRQMMFSAESTPMSYALLQYFQLTAEPAA